MTEQSIGTARLDIVVDTTSMQTGVDAAVRKTKELDAATTGASQKAEVNSRRQVAALEKQIATMGKSRDEIVRWRIETQTAGETQKRLLAAHDAATAKINAGATALGRYGVSAKQQAAALRGVPAQITDIATALQGGQRPLTVLLQQGGQLKDMFGGIVPAARALGSAVLSLVNPLTITIAAVAALGIAWKEAADEQDAFQRAITLTGNEANLTTEQLRSMAAQIDASSAATEGKASDALAAVAATGKFTADQIALVAEAAVNLENATGRSIEKTISEFAELEKAPVDAILKLNDAIGDGTNVVNFLTQAQIEAINKFKEQGREADAARVAIEAYADAINGRSSAVVADLNAWSSLWRSIGSGVKTAWDNVVGFMRDSDASQAMARSLQRAFLLPGGYAQPMPEPIYIGFKPGAKPVDSQEYKDRKKAEEEFARLAESNLSKREKLEAEIKDIREKGAKAKASELEIEKAINNARARYQESLPKGRKPRKPRNNDRSIENASDRFDDMVGRFQAELQGPLERAEQEHLKRMREIQQAARDGKRSHEDLTSALNLEAEAYGKTKAEIEQRFAAEVAGLSGPMVQAQSEHEQALRRIEELKRLGFATGEQYNAMLAEEAVRHRESAAEAARRADPIGAMLSDMREEVAWIGKSNAERAISNELTRQGIDLSGEYAQAKLAEARAIEQAGIAQQRTIDLMDEFRDGAENALFDFVTGAKSAKDALKDFFDEMAKAITRAITEQWIEKLFGPKGSSNGGMAGGGEGGWLGAIMGLFSGNLFAKGGAFDNGQQVRAFAKGGVFDGGVQKFATGGIVSSPTMFPMRSGMGLMGEDGPEAIVPLKRTKDGSLGIRMETTPQAQPMNLSQTFIVQGTPDKRTREQMARTSGREARRGMARTGAV